MQVRAHTSEFGRWEVCQRGSDPRIRGYVHGYFASSSALPKPVRERHLPSTEVSLLLNFGTPHRRLDVEEPERRTSLDGVWVVGLHDRHQLSEAVGERHFMVVRFTPIGAHHFLGLPLSLVANEAVQLSQIDPKLEELILGRVGRARSWSDRFLAIETLIVERLLDPEASSSMEWAWNRLAAANGAVPLGLLATEIGCSHRHLIAQFRSRIGLPPKAIARVLRFNRALRLLNKLPDDRADRPAGKPYIETGHSLATRGETTPWADIAARCGYFDQSHFIKEFRRFAGITPNAFLQRMSNID